MPTIQFNGQVISCESGTRLRDALKKAGQTPHNDRANLLNCKGFGSCGTCAVRIEGPVSKPGVRERWRLSVPPHTPGSGLRLACQARVLGDVRVEKFPGFWGQHVPGITSSEDPA